MPKNSNLGSIELIFTGLTPGSVRAFIRRAVRYSLIENQKIEGQIEEGIHQLLADFLARLPDDFEYKEKDRVFVNLGKVLSFTRKFQIIAESIEEIINRKIRELLDLLKLNIDEHYRLKKDQSLIHIKNRLRTLEHFIDKHQLEDRTYTKNLIGIASKAINEIMIPKAAAALK